MGAGVFHFRADSAEEMQAAASSVFVPLRVRDRDGERFRATIDDASVGPVIVTRISTVPAVVSRDTRCITSTDPDLLKVSLHRGGPVTLDQDGRHCALRPGDLVAYETARPYRLTGVDRSEMVVIAIPRGMLGASADLIGRRTAVAVPCERGTRAVVAGLLSGLADDLDALPGPGGVHLADALVSLVISAFAEPPAEGAEDGTEPADRILAYALANLADPGLCADTVARAHGISTRYLYKILQRRDIGFAAWVRNERLRRIRRDLADPAFTHRTVAAIAARWGMTEAGHLSRAFRAEFGQTPSEFRRTLPGRPEPAPPRPDRAATGRRTLPRG